MKNHHYHWAVPITGVLLLGAGVPAYAASGPDSAFDSTNRVTLSLRFGLNLHAKFSGFGTAAGAGQYFDGYVLTDSTGNYLGYTSNWGYDHAGQYNPNNTFTFNRPSLVGNSAGNTGGDTSGPGFEIAYDHQFGVKEDWHNLRYGLEGALNYLNISLNNSGSSSTAIATDTYTFGGIPGQIPAAGYRGTYNGNPGDPVLVAGATPGSATGTLQTKDNFSADLWGGRLGPYVELPLGKQEQFTLALSGGLALGLINANESWQETLTPLNGSPSTISGGGSSFDILWGWYLGATANYQLNKQWGLSAGLQYQDLGTYSHNFSGRNAQLDLSQALYFQVGVSYSF